MGVDETNTVGQGFTPAARLVRMEQAPSLRYVERNSVFVKRATDGRPYNINPSVNKLTAPFTSEPKL